MANAIRLTAGPDGQYWIRVVDDKVGERIRQLVGPLRHERVLRHLLLVGLDGGQAETLIQTARQTRTATIRGIGPDLTIKSKI